MDAPAHMQQRGMVEPLFVREHIASMKPYIQKTVDDLLDKMVEQGCDEPVDLIEQFALPVPSYVSVVVTLLRPGIREEIEETRKGEVIEDT